MSAPIRLLGVRKGLGAVSGGGPASRNDVPRRFPPEWQSLGLHRFIGVPERRRDLVDPVVGLGSLLRSGADGERDD